MRPPHPSARDLIDRNDFWAIRLLLSYQPSIGYEADPNSMPNAASTGEYRGGDACVFFESIREENRGALSVPANPTGNTNFLVDKYANVAHEIGHAPNPGLLEFRNDHLEGGLMTSGIEAGTNVPFTAQTILRFRKSKKWSD